MAIRINKDLARWADFDPTKESNPKPLRDLCREIEMGNIVLPIFQTYIRWQVEKSIELLNFQLTGFAAVAPISINRIKKQGDVGMQISFITREKIPQEEVVNKDSVIDGQQRLTCNYKAYSDHPDFRNIVFDISLGKFVLNNEELKNSQIPVGVLYNKDAAVFDQFLKDRPPLQSADIFLLLGKIRNKFMGYYYTVNIANDLTETQQLEWFEVLNLAGTKVTGVQVELTEMLVKGVDYYTEYAARFHENLRAFGLVDLLVQKSTELSIPLAMLNPAIEVLQGRRHKHNFCPMPSDVKPSLMSKLKAEEIRELFTIALNGLTLSLEFIEEKGLERPTRIDYVTNLAGAFMYARGNEVDEAQLISWYNKVDFA